jgi:hypothetical protein
MAREKLKGCIPVGGTANQPTGTLDLNSSPSIRFASESR